MCGIATTSIRTLKKDLKVYEIRHQYLNGEIKSLLCSYFWNLGQLHEDFLFSPNELIKKGDTIVYGFHSQLRKKDLIESIKAGEFKREGIFPHESPIEIIVRSIIPKGSKYIRTINHRCSKMLDGKKSIVSNQLIPEKIVYKEKR